MHSALDPAPADAAALAPLASGGGCSIGDAPGAADAPVADGAAHLSVSPGLVALGTLLVIGASFISCVGVNLQKLAHNQEEARRRAGLGPRRMTRMWRWWAGILCMILGSAMDLAALPLVPLSRVAALGASGIVANVVVTPLFLKERLTIHDVVGCFITVGGTALTCVFGASEEHSIDSHCMLLLFAEPIFIAYGLSLALALAALWYLIVGFRRTELRARQLGVIGGAEPLSPAAAELPPAAASERSLSGGDGGVSAPYVRPADAPGGSPIELPLSAPAPAAAPAPPPAAGARPTGLETVWLHAHLDEFRRRVAPDPGWVFVTRCGAQFYPAVHAAFAGAIGAQSVGFSKLVLLFLLHAARGADVARSVGLLVAFLIPTLFCLYHQIGQLNRALKIYTDAVFVMPVYQAIWICTGIASGLTFYQEYRRISSQQVGLFATGIAVTLCGLFVLTRRRSRRGDAATAAELPRAAAAAAAAGGKSPPTLPPSAGPSSPCSQPLALLPAAADVPRHTPPPRDALRHLGLHHHSPLV